MNFTHRLRLLVVDDSVTTRTLEKGILEAAGYRVVVCVDGQDALDRLRRAMLSDRPAHVEDMELHRAIVEATASSGAEVLAKVIATDEGARRLGEGGELPQARLRLLLAARVHADQHDALEAQLAVLDLGDVGELGGQPGDPAQRTALLQVVAAGGVVGLVPLAGRRGPTRQRSARRRPTPRRPAPLRPAGSPATDRPRRSPALCPGRARR